MQYWPASRYFDVGMLEPNLGMAGPPIIAGERRERGNLL